ncbi:type VI secretion system baseplate subunit TssE (plasmid) [Photobacterium sp. GJ3]|uniref:type VI secretion system baseplate subunit TssE n=1 Tax=Photobacterium sp. GJ3 TaxID=2829502 RepID=UPI001B8BBFE8|nr:type VI secretion system baseplate subunit TssE [Photobacterium sp. GJ3]QUJ70024.1 type VI secretion system baseplate subunit TssE [Photobacterium sp. GJ3]
MDKGYRLLERIELGESKNSYDTVGSTQYLIESIHYHLADLLNTHTGNAMIALDYGLPDFNDVLADKSNIVREIRHSVKQTIEKYEPRLTGVVVRYIPHADNPLQLNFAVSGEVYHNDKKTMMNIDLSVGVDGKFSV